MKNNTTKIQPATSKILSLQPLKEFAVDKFYQGLFQVKAGLRELPGTGKRVVTFTTDADYTLYDLNSFEEVLVDDHGKYVTEGAASVERQWAEFRDSGIKGNELLVLSHQLRINAGITEDHWRDLFKRMEDNHLFDMDFIHMLQGLQENGNIKVFVTTKSSSILAQLISEKFGFKGGFGTVMDYEAGMINQLVGDVTETMRDGTVALSKFDMVNNSLPKGQYLDRKQHAHVADDWYDRGDLYGCKYGFLKLPKGSLTTSQLRAYQNGLYDGIVRTKEDFVLMARAILHNDPSAVRELNYKARDLKFVVRTNTSVPKSNGVPRTQKH